MSVINGARYKLHPAHQADLANTNFRALISESKTINKDFILSGSNEIELRENLSSIDKYVGEKVRFINCSFGFVYFEAYCLYGIFFKKIDHREKVQRLCEPIIYSNENVRKAFDTTLNISGRYCSRSK